MSSLIAFTICSIGVWGLFYLNRNKAVRTSTALWIPVIWLMISGSRPVSMWFGIRDEYSDTLASTLEGSSWDAAFYGILLALGVMVLIGRNRRASLYLKRMTPIIIYSLYCLVSVTWAPYSGPAFKRWTKDLGDIVMALVVATDPDPVEALRQLFSRVGFFLLPFSVFMIRYTDTGRAFDPEGGPMNTGVTMNKNSLGLIVFIISLGTLWTLRTLLANRAEPNRRRRLIAQGTLLGLGIILLWLAHSSTSDACFLLGAILLVATSTRAMRTRPARVHLLCLTILLLGGIVLLVGGLGSVAGALGRQANLSGRTLIWAAVIPAAPNALIGAGFDSFWTSPSAAIFHRNLLNWYHADQINEAHNGYIEVYLNLGWLGIVLLSALLISGYRRAVASFRQNASAAGLMVAFVVCGAFYSITEAGFRTLTPMWIMLLTSITCSIGMSSGLWIPAKIKRSARVGAVNETAILADADTLMAAEGARSAHRLVPR